MAQEGVAGPHAEEAEEEGYPDGAADKIGLCASLFCE